MKPKKLKIHIDVDFMVNDENVSSLFPELNHMDKNNITLDDLIKVVKDAHIENDINGIFYERENTKPHAEVSIDGEETEEVKEEP